jgi:hypothetical protein
MFPMHVPDAIATLGDERAVPALINILSLDAEKVYILFHFILFIHFMFHFLFGINYSFKLKPPESKGEDSDADDDVQILASSGKTRLQQECCVALSVFLNNHPEYVGG